MSFKAAYRSEKFGVRIRLPIPLQEFRNVLEGCSAVPNWPASQNPC